MADICVNKNFYWREHLSFTFQVLYITFQTKSIPPSTIFHSLLKNAKVKELLKLVYMCQSCCTNIGGMNGVYLHKTYSSSWLSNKTKTIQVHL